MNCADVTSRLAAYVDGDGGAQHAEIASHLDACPACRVAAQAQAAARAVLKARAPQLSATAPPGLRTRIAATLSEGTPRRLTWPGRLSAVAPAVIVVIALGGVVLPFATVQSATLLAAQLALDHLKCFAIGGDAGGARIGKADAEATLRRDYGIAASVPDSAPDGRLELLGVRRCLYGDGLAAHLLYRAAGEPVSLFILPGVARPPAELHVLGHHEIAWTQGDRTFMLVAHAGSAAALARVAPHIRNEAK